VIKIKLGKQKLAEAGAGDVNAEKLTDSDRALLKMVSKADIEDRDVGIKVLLDAGYIPIITGRTVQVYDRWRGEMEDVEKLSAELGAGVYGKVYEATKAGSDKRYAVKVLGEDQNELQIRQKIEDMRESMPPEVARHFVKMHEAVKKVAFVGPQKERTEFTLIAMDLVRPLKTVEKSVLYRGLGSLTRLIAEVKLKDNLQDYRVIKKCLLENIAELSDTDATIRTFISAIADSKLQDEFIKRFQKDIPAVLEMPGSRNKYNSIVHDIMQTDKDGSQRFNELLKATLEQFASYMVSTWMQNFGANYSKFFKNPEATLNPETVVKVAKAFSLYSIAIARRVREIAGLSLSTSDGMHMVRNYDNLAQVLAGFDDMENREIVQKAFISRDMPEGTKSFIGALLYLAHEKGIFFKDLHEANVMVDPKTGDYVAVDIGMFTTAKHDPRSGS
jgi:serine/threonine protein kinase